MPLPSAALACFVKALTQWKFQHYPHASFTLSQGDDPEGVYLRVLLNVADPDEVVDVYIDRLLQFQT
jgi:hypothetical protein